LLSSAYSSAPACQRRSLRKNWLPVTCAKVPRSRAGRSVSCRSAQPAELGSSLLRTVPQARIRGFLKPILTWRITAASGHNMSRDSRSTSSPIWADWSHWRVSPRRPTSSVGLADQRRPRERDSQRSATRTGRFGRTQTTRTKADSQARLGVVQACQHFPSETLSREQIREIIDALGEHAAENSAQLIASLSALLT
jgi:hypothetical protein